jgi:hypothetical protein
MPFGNSEGFDPANMEVAGACYYSSIPPSNFCSGADLLWLRSGQATTLRTLWGRSIRQRLPDLSNNTSTVKPTTFTATPTRGSCQPTARTAFIIVLCLSRIDRTLKLPGFTLKVCSQSRGSARAIGPWRCRSGAARARFERSPPETDPNPRLVGGADWIPSMPERNLTCEVSKRTSPEVILSPDVRDPSSAGTGPVSPIGTDQDQAGHLRRARTANESAHLPLRQPIAEPPRASQRHRYGGAGRWKNHCRASSPFSASSIGSTR